MLNLELLAERVARTNLQKRRDKEAKRQERIFNDKTRTIGVDKEALDMLVEEKKIQDEAAKEEQKSYDADMLRNSKAACLLHSRQAKERRAMEKEMVNFRLQYQQPCCRREYDLNDQDRCRKTEQGERMAPILLGEDPDSRSRVRRQREQLEEWLIQQQTERAALTHQQQLENQRYNQSSLDMDNEVMQLHEMEMKRRKAAAVATKEYNLALIEERRHQEDCYQQPTGVEAKPSPGEVGVPGLCPSRDRKSPPENLQQILQFQKYQMEERQRMELEKKKEDEQHDRVRLNSARAALLMERQQARVNKQLRRDQDSTNVQLARLHRQQKPDIKRGGIDDSFFSKFNTSSR